MLWRDSAILRDIHYEQDLTNFIFDIQHINTVEIVTVNAGSNEKTGILS